MDSLGICIGASTLSIVALTRDPQGKIFPSPVLVQPHHGNPRSALSASIAAIPFNHDTRIAVTGRKFRQWVNLSNISEPEAVEYALKWVNGNGRPIDAVVSAGGETFMVYILGRDGKICSVRTGNKCASGTGEFYLQQLRRIGLSLEDAAKFSSDGNPYMVSGRCSVFCKSDCTHATNKGVPRERIAAGLSRMMAGKILEITKQLAGRRIMLIGGTVQNSMMVDYLRKEFAEVIIPPQALYFEALGSALWALRHETASLVHSHDLFNGQKGSFFLLPPLKKYADKVDFRRTSSGIARKGDRCILGLDVGSTTTKAIILRIEDHQTLASVYLRTHGNPVASSRACYAHLVDQLKDLADQIRIVGLGVTGSGRQIAGLHAMTRGIINEIIAHAAGALFYDHQVDTIFEIGGQDAKYTFIINGVPADYAMNEACSAGTGSFLEESARETMDMNMENIGPMALEGQSPPNFNDQCAAFISSDIKNAFHENIKQEDILAGLVYSVCMNYDHRVKGNRPIGKRIFMQGGVCYNQAVPIAMAALTGKAIIVPPDPGLTGAFGVAMEIKRLLSEGLMEEGDFSLTALRDRALAYEQPFICNGGKEKCDRKCEIARIRIDGKVYPFGGICSRWYNQRLHRKEDAEALNIVRFHEKLVFEAPGINASTDLRPSDAGQPTVGINRSFLVNTYYPFYREFFSRLGYQVKLSERPAPEGIDRKLAPFCYPAEIAHGCFADLLQQKPDYLFLPHLKGAFVAEDAGISTICPLSQGEPYYLTTAFGDHAHLQKLISEGRVLKPVVDFSQGILKAEPSFIGMAKSLGRSTQKVRKAFAAAAQVQATIRKAMQEKGLRFLADLEGDAGRHAVVIFGRSYNACASQLNMGIPDKFASRGIAVMPIDFLPLQGESFPDGMYWSSGQLISRAAALVMKHPQLFGCFITNFSCGPDSFLLTYFRHIMGSKPFLILELDSHVADAGLDTRIEAFLDIIGNYKKLAAQTAFQSPTIRTNKRAYFDMQQQTFVDTQGKKYALTDPQVHLVFPSMGPLVIDLVAATFRSIGIRSTALPPPDEEVLKLGQGHTSGKECLPLQLTVGSLLRYLKDRKDPDERLLYFMPTTSGPCRFGQYAPFIHQLVDQLALENVALLSLQSKNGYQGLGSQDVTLKVWSCLVVADILSDIYAAVCANAVDRPEALRIYRQEAARIRKVFECSSRWRDIRNVLRAVAENLSRIPTTRPIEETPFVLLTGEIYVRHDDFSRQGLVEKLADQGFAVKVSSAMEWIYYTNWCYAHDLEAEKPAFSDRLSLAMRSNWMKHTEKICKNIMARSNLLVPRRENVGHLIENVRHLINPELTGEAVLTIGASMSEILDHYCGVIAIGPFGCMPNRLAEAILTREMDRRRVALLKDRRKTDRLPDTIQDLPFLSIESDGKLFPQIITAKLEVFLMQAMRIHQAMVVAGR